MFLLLPSQAIHRHSERFVFPVTWELKFHTRMKNRQCYSFVYTHPSLSAEAGFQERPPTSEKRKSANNRQPASPKSFYTF
jgi:hypothetical protein